MEVKNIKDYLSIEDGYDFIKNDIKELDYEYNEYIPFCILSYKFDKRRSKFIVELIDSLKKERTNRKIFCFIYKQEYELYKFLEEYNIELVLIDYNDDTNTLTKKRNFIVNYMTGKFKHIFMIEDDCYNYMLPYPLFDENKNFKKNLKIRVSIFDFFKYWEHLIYKYKLNMSAPLIENSMVWNVRHNSVYYNCTCIQVISLNLDFMKRNNMLYDNDSGWDDFDMNLQFLKNKSKLGVIYACYCTIPLKGGLSTVDNNLIERGEKNSNLLQSKWGPNIVRLETKRGVPNARIRWVSLKHENFKQFKDLKNEE